MKKNSFRLIIILWFITLLSLPIKHVEPVENKSVEIGVAFDVSDVNDINNNNYSYKVTRNVSIYSDINNVLFSQNIEGIGYSIGKTREDRQNRDNKIPLQGMEKVYLFSEKQCLLGIKPCVDILFKNPSLSDNGIFAVCSGEGKDILDFKIPGYISSLDYIYGLIKNSNSSNFFPETYYMSNVHVRMDAEGRNFVVPYIDIKDNTPYIWGNALFIKDKLKSKIDINETKIMNLLRENNTKGIISINYSLKDYIDFECISRRKIKCEKKDGRWIFTINLNLKGNIVNNEINNNIINDDNVIKTFEQLLADKVEKDCSNFINNIQHKYMTDWLELGKYAVAKYGRKTDIDWNEEIINNSDIVVKVNVTINNLGRGDY